MFALSSVPYNNSWILFPIGFGDVNADIILANPIAHGLAFRSHLMSYCHPYRLAEATTGCIDPRIR